jgi:hypothetical protein
MFCIYLKYAHCRTAAHGRIACQLHTAGSTAGQPHTAAHTAAMPDTAVHSAAHTLHESECQTAAHRILHTARNRTPQLTWIKTIVCNVIVYASTWITVNLCELYEFIWIKTVLFEYIPSLWIYKNINMILKNLISNYLIIPNLHEFIRICFEFIWKYAHCRTAAHCWNVRLPHTTAHCRTLPNSRPLRQALPHTAVHGQVHCRTHPRALPQISMHTAAHCRTAAQPHTATWTATRCCAHRAHCMI